MTLTSDRWQRVQELFDAALERSGEERSSYLAAECSGDRELLEDVESLLDHDTQAEADFMRPAVRDRDLTEAPESLEEDPFIGTTVGRFHIQARIASGGMGIVYEAVQDAPRRTVALKIMRRGIPSRSALRRFQYEAQIMGRLRHPGIAQIFEAGVHDASGARVPYFAMEYIPEARDILEYAEDEKLDIRRRLELFAQVCDAVNHGHQRGIIHRDLKPANVLIDSTGNPKVIDFGVARATESDLAMTTVQTNIGQLVGTVQYMSPEQCAADPNDLDVRTDVYSLGVVLYELLSGKLPYQTSL